MFLQAVRLLCAGALVAAVAVPACGNSSDSGPTATAGSGGTAGGHGGNASGGQAGAVDSGPITCGAKMCASETLVLPNTPPLTLAACCADESTSACGLDTTFLSMFGPSFANPCQARDQPGPLAKTCSDSVSTPIQGTPLKISFHGCCRAETGTCGYDLAKVFGIYPLGLGCVDSGPFLDGGTPATCGDSAGAGQGGGAGAGESPAGSSGQPSSGGATSG